MTCSDFKRIEGPGHYSVHKRPHKENKHASHRTSPTAGPGEAYTMVSAFSAGVQCREELI